MFGLWHKAKMIGESSIDFTAVGKDGKRIADFEGSEIAKDYRGKGLIDKFYDARKQYLKDINFKDEIKTTIRPDNHPSLKAAKRNGFQDTGTINEHGKCLLTYTGKLDDGFKAQPKQGTFKITP